MSDSAARITGGLLLLVALWIGVYWWWPSEPKITFANGSARSELEKTGVAPAWTEPPRGTERVTRVRPADPVPVEPAPSPRPALPPEVARELPPEPAVIPPAFIEHTIRKGESFATIARTYFGSSGKAGVIARANPLKDPQRLKPGDVIRVPKDPTNIQGKPNPRAGEGTANPAPGSVRYADAREYTVQPGDTLSGISETLYGTQANVDLIYEANRDQLRSRNDLKVGQKLRIPQGTGSAPAPR